MVRCKIDAVYYMTTQVHMHNFFFEFINVVIET